MRPGAADGLRQGARVRRHGRYERSRFCFDVRFAVPGTAAACAMRTGASGRCCAANPVVRFARTRARTRRCRVVRNPRAGSRHRRTRLERFARECSRLRAWPTLAADRKSSPGRLRRFRQCRRRAGRAIRRETGERRPRRLALSRTAHAPCERRRRDASPPRCGRRCREA